MDLHCPATIICLALEDRVPASVGGQRIVAAYLFQLESESLIAPVPVRPAPDGTFWECIGRIADLHRGEGVVLFAPEEILVEQDLRGVALRADSSGPTRIGCPGDVDNP